jgi:hypothetical protein
VEFPTLSTPTGANISIATNGFISLSGNITYQISHRVDNVPSTFDNPAAGHVINEIATQTLLYPLSKMGQTNTILYTPNQNVTLILVAYMPDGIPPNTTTQPLTWQYPQQIQNAEISIVQVGGAT